MINYIVRRFYYMIITLILVSIIGFIIINLPPGSYLDIKMMELEEEGTSTAQKQIEQIKHRYRLGDPIYIQYFRWARGFIQGDFGMSFMYNKEVNELIWNRLVFSIILSTSTMLFTWIVAIPIGTFSACNQYTKWDHMFTFVGFIGLSIPNFLLALIFMVIGAMVFNHEVGGLFSQMYVNAPWSIGKFIDFIKHLWIPVVVIGTAGTARLIRVMRSNLLDILQKEYIRTARSKGLKESIVIYKHAVRNALHPLIMMLGMSLPKIISGSTVVGLVLSLPTMGPLYFRALRSQDMFLAGTFLMFMAIMLVLGNLIADIMLVWVDPRIVYD